MPLTGLDLPAPVDLEELLQLGLQTKPDEPALTADTGCLTWKELAEATSRLASAYLDLGLKSGDRIATLMPNRPAQVIHNLACLRAGLVATPLNYRYTHSEIDHALQVSGASLLIHHQERAPDIAKSQFAGSLAQGRIEFSDGADCGFSLLMANGDPNATFARHPLDSPAFILFTSGSTGSAKGVTHTRETLGWILASVSTAFQLSPADVVMPGSSFSHMAATIFSLASLANGTRVIVPRGNHPEELLPLLRLARPTVMFVLPATLSLLVRDHDTVRDDFESLRVCLAGGDKLSEELEDEYTELVGRPIEEGYGMTEIGHAVTLPIGSPFRQGSVGKPCPGFEFSIRSEDGAELPRGCEGRAWVRFPGITAGYWEHPEATTETIVDGWLDTGDVMFADEDGYLWFHGRKKQIIVHDGSNIFPGDVEEAMAKHPAVESVGVIGVHDRVHGENVRAYVTLRKGLPQPTASELIHFARDWVGYKAPEEIVFLEKLPVNAAGKTDRMLLKRLAEEQKDRKISRHHN
jgi:long-chain acyl-CoA synthetase